MQLQITAAELQLLARILEENQTELRRAIAGGCDSEPSSARRLQELEDMLEKVRGKWPAFCADELLSLGDIIQDTERAWNSQRATSGNPARIARLELDNATLRVLKHKIAECCAMV